MKPSFKVTPRPVITFVIAPDIPCGEVPKLRKKWNTKKRVVVNYSVDVLTFDLEDVKNGKLLVSAIGVPKTEIKALRQHIREAIKDPSYAVVVNYQIDARVV